MKHLIFSALLLFIGTKSTLLAQKTTAKVDSIYIDEEMADFPGGYDSLMKYISENLVYPQSAIDLELTGRVICKFVVEKNGTVSNITFDKRINLNEVIKSRKIQSSEEIQKLEQAKKDMEANLIQVLLKLPKFIPPKRNGETIRSYYYLPIHFTLN